MRAGRHPWGFLGKFAPFLPSLCLTNKPSPRPGGLLITGRKLLLIAGPPNLQELPQDYPKAPGKVRMMPWDRRLSQSSQSQFSLGEAEARQP